MHVRKGQYFIIATVFILIAIILIKGMFGLFDIARERQFHEGVYLEKNLENIAKEYEYLVGVTSLQNNPEEWGISSIWNFTNFIRAQIDSRMLYVFVVSNRTSNRYYVTVGNFLKDRITARVNVTNSTTLGGSFGTMDDKKNSTLEFTPSINGTINITITYNIKTEEIVEKFFISTPSDFVSGFFDITLESRNFIVRTKEVYNRTL